MKSKKIIILTLAIASSLLLLSIVTLNLILRVIDISPYLNQIEQKMEEGIQRKVSIGNARISFIKDLALILENVTIKDKNQGGNLITSEKVFVTLYFLPLLRQHIVIKKVNMIRPLIKISLSKEGENNFLNWMNEMVPTQKVTGSQKKKLFLPMMKKLTIQKGHLIFRDMQISETPLITNIIDLDINIQSTFFKKSIEGLITGEIKSDKKAALFRIKSEIKKAPALDGFTLESLIFEGDISLNSLSVKKFQPYLKQYSGDTKWDGAIDINVNYKGSIARGFESIGEIKFESFGSSGGSILSDPGKIKHWGLNYDLFLNKKKLEINELQFKLNDLIFTGKSLVEAPFSKNPQISFALQSTPFNIQTHIKNIPFYLMPAPVRVFEDKLIRGNLKFGSVDFKGSLNQLKNIHKQENFGFLNGKITAKKVDFKMQAKGPIFKEFSGILEFKNGNLKFSNISGLYKDSKITEVSCVIISPFEKPTINLSGRASLQLDQIYQTLSRKKFFIKNIGNSKNIRNISGRAEGRVNISGNLKKLSELNYFATMELSDVAFSHNDLVYPFRNISGRAKFFNQLSLVPAKNKDLIGFFKNLEKKYSGKGHHFYISSLSARYGDTEIKNITGGIFGNPSKPLFNLKIDSDMSLKEMHPLLVSFINREGALEHLNQINISSGRSKVKAKISNFSSVENKWDISGDLQIMDAYVSHSDLPLKISKLKGNISFSNNEVKWKELSGLFGKSAFSMSGKTPDFTAKNPKIDMQINSEINLNEIFNALDLPEKENYFVNGIADIKLGLKGDYHSMATSAEVDLTKSSFKYKDRINKKIGKTAKISFDGVVERFLNIYFNEFQVDFGMNKVIGNGIISDLKNPYFNFKIHKTNIDLAEAAGLFQIDDNKLIAGKLTTSFNVKGSIKGEKRFELEGNANLTGGSYKFEFSPNAIKNINADFDFKDQEIDIKNAVFSFGKSDARVSGKIRNFEKPEFRLKLKSRNFDLNQILPIKVNSIKDINALLSSSSAFRLAHGKIYLDAEKGQFRSYKFPHTNGEIELKEGLIMFNLLKAHFSKNHITAKGKLDFLSDKGLKFSVKLFGKSFPAKDFENIFQNYFRNSVTGRLSLSAQLSGAGFNMEQISKSLFGKLSLLLIKGHYNKQSLISGIKQILGFESEEAKEKLKQDSSTKFDFINGRFDIYKGVAITESYVIATPSVRTLAIGSLDLGNKKLNLSVGIAPWQKLNKAMSKIPIVGTILTGGDDKSLLINYYSVKGEMGSPKVSLVPLKSLGLKVISLIKGILQTPKEILAPGK